MRIPVCLVYLCASAWYSIMSFTIHASWSPTTSCTHTQTRINTHTHALTHARTHAYARTPTQMLSFHVNLSYVLISTYLIQKTRIHTHAHTSMRTLARTYTYARTNWCISVSKNHKCFIVYRCLSVRRRLDVSREGAIYIA